MNAAASVSGSHKLPAPHQEKLGKRVAIFEEKPDVVRRARIWAILWTLAAIGLVVINVVQGFGWVPYLPVLLLALFAWFAATKRRTVIEVYERGVVTWGQRVSPS